MYTKKQPKTFKGGHKINTGMFYRKNANRFSEANIFLWKKTTFNS